MVACSFPRLSDFLSFSVSSIFLSAPLFFLARLFVLLLPLFFRLLELAFNFGEDGAPGSTSWAMVGEFCLEIAWELAGVTEVVEAVLATVAIVLGVAAEVEVVAVITFGMFGCVWYVAGATSPSATGAVNATFSSTSPTFSSLFSLTFRSRSFLSRSHFSAPAPAVHNLGT